MQSSGGGCHRVKYVMASWNGKREFSQIFCCSCDAATFMQTEAAAVSGMRNLRGAKCAIFPSTIANDALCQARQNRADIRIIIANHRCAVKRNLVGERRVRIADFREVAIVVQMLTVDVCNYSN